MKNKKLVLIATAAMGVVALGTAGVSTAAWYQASTMPKVQSNAYNNTISTTETSITLGSMEIQFSVANITAIQLSDLREISSTPTLYKGMISGGNVTGADVTGGQLTEAAVTEGEVGDFVKQYSITASYKTATDAQKASVVGKHVTATVKGYGQVKLRADQALTGADQATQTITVTFTSTSVITVTGCLYARVQAAQVGSAGKVDVASDHTNDKIQVEAFNNVDPVA